MIRTFKISDKLLQGFTVIIPNLKSTDTPNYCLQFVVNEMRIVLKNLNLELLVKHIDDTNFHIHESWQDILDYPDRIFWICSHE